MNDVLNRIIDELHKQKKKTTELCKAAGIANSTFSTWKKENREPQLKYIPSIAKFLGVSIDYLLTGKNDNVGYYFDPEVAEMAQEMATRPELKVLFSASRKVSKESLEAINNMIEQMRKDYD